MKNLFHTRCRQNKIEHSRQEIAHPFLSLREEMNRLFDVFFKETPDFPTRRAESNFAAFHPLSDMTETEKALNITVELPGLSEKDVEVCIARGVLSISGEKKEEKQEKDSQYRYIERRSGSFCREIALPANVDMEKAQATFRNGVLTVSIPKLAQKGKECKTIPISCK